MPKVKMSDIKSGSEEVKKVFRRPMSARKKPLKNQVFTNDEMLEILDISENIEYHSDKRSFYQALIESQKGPFNRAVFRAYVDKLFHIDSLLSLLENATGLTEDDKKEWLNYLMVTSAHWAVFNFFSRGSGNSFGIDVTKNPYRKVYSELIVRYTDKMGRGNVAPEYYAELNRILDTMTDDEIFEWYLNAVKTTYVKRAKDFIMNYPKMPEKVVVDYYNKLTGADFKEELVKHPNMTAEIKLKMYEETGREEYLPQTAKDIFLF